MKIKGIFAGILMASMIFAGCATQGSDRQSTSSATAAQASTETAAQKDSKSKEAKDGPSSTNEAVKSLNDQDKKLVDTFKEQNKQMYDQLKEMNKKEMSSSQYKATRESLQSQLSQLYGGEDSYFQEVYNALSSDSALRQSLEELKEQSDAVKKNLEEGAGNFFDLNLSSFSKALESFERTFEAPSK